MHPRAVFLDFGGTLVVQIADPIDVWGEVSRTLNLEVGRAELERALSAANDWFQTDVFSYHGRTSELWHEYEQRVVRHLGIQNPGRLAPLIQERFRQVEWNRPYPESRDVLRSLRARGYPLHLISNATDEVVDRLRSVGLADYLDSVTYSQEAGANKPDPRPFKLALRRAKCAPHEAVHIGNRYEDDVVGARGVGISPILVDRNDEWPSADCPRVHDLRGVLALLD